MEEKRDEKLQQIAEKALTDSVVRVVWQKTDEESGERLIWPRASGFFIDTNLVVTNIHCVAGAPSFFAELVSTKTEFPIEGVAAFDTDNDLVILKVAGEGTPLPFGDIDTVQIDDIFCVVGYPGGEKGVVTQITIQGVRNSNKRLQIKEDLAPGYSGSAVLNRMGEFIGVAVGTASSMLMFSGATTLSISRAIPVSAIQFLLVNAGEMMPLDEWQKHPHIQGFSEVVQAQMSMRQGKNLEALKCLDAAIELNPNSVDIYANRAGLKILMGEAEDAIIDCDSAIKLNPDFVEAYINRASANLSLDQHNEAIADCDAALKLNPDFVQAYVIRATAKFAAEFDSEQHKEALVDYDIALKLNPNAAEIYFARAHVRVVLEDYAGAIEDYDKMISLTPEPNPLLNVFGHRGDAKHLNRDYEGAIEDYDKVIQSNPQDDEAYNGRGRAKYYLGRSKADENDETGARKYYQEAIDDYSEAMKLDPENRSCYFNRGLAKRELGDYEEAITDYDKVIQLNPKSDAGYFQRAYAKHQLGISNADHGDVVRANSYFQGAIDDYTESIKLDPDHAFSYNNRGLAKNSLGKIEMDQENKIEAQVYYQESVDDYSEAIKLKSTYTDAYNGRGWSKYILGQLETDTGNIEEAKNLFHAAIVDSSEGIRLQQNNPSAATYHTRATAKAALGNYDDAIEDFDEAIRIKPDDALYYYERGQAKQALGKHEESKADLAKAKELDPDVENKLF